MGRNTELVESEKHGLWLDVGDSDTDQMSNAIVRIAIRFDPLDLEEAHKEFFCSGACPVHFGGPVRTGMEQLCNGAEADAAGNIFEAGATSAFLVPTQDERAEAEAPSDQQGSGALRTPEFGAAERHEVGAQVIEGDWIVTDSLSGIDMHEHATLTAARHNFCDRLSGADLMICPLDVDDRGVVGDGGVNFIGVDSAHVVDPDRGDQSLAFCALTHCRMLDGPKDLMGASIRRADARGSDGFGCRGGEDHLAASGADKIAQLRASVFECRACLHPLLVHPSRVA